MACAEAGIQPIIGTVLGVSSFTKAERKHNQSEVDSLILLVQHEAGYRNLLKLSSKRISRRRTAAYRMSRMQS